MDAFLLLMAYTTGAVAFFSPCCVAMLPAYIGYFMGRKVGKKKLSLMQAVSKGASFGIMTTMGLLTVFIIVGILMAAAGTAVRPFLGKNLPWLILVVAIALIILGVLMLLEVNLSIPVPMKAPSSKTQAGFYTFGIGYGLVALGCNFPLFLMLLTSSLKEDDFIGAFFIFLMYALGKGTLMMTLSLLLAAGKDLAVKKVMRVVPVMKKVGSLLLLIMGVYLLWYFSTIYQLL